MDAVEYEMMTEEEVAQTLPLDVIEQEVNKMVCEIEGKGKDVSPDSKKNAYTKACLLLGIFQKTVQFSIREEKFARYFSLTLSKEQRYNVESNVRFLKAALPRLREKYQR